MKAWKKATVATLVATAMMGGAAPAFAEEAVAPVPIEKPQQPQPTADMIQEAEAIAKVKAIFGEMAHLQQQGAYYSDDTFYGVPAWSVFFSPAMPGTVDPAQQEKPQEMLHATIDAKTGALLSFNHQHPEWQGELVPSEELAAAKAKEGLEKYAPELIGKVEYYGSYGSGSTTSGSPEGASFKWTYRDARFIELVNGIPFENNSLSFSVDQYGHVVGMHRHFQFDSSKLPDASQAISKESATDILAKSLKMEKYYQTRIHNYADGELEIINTPILAYSARSMSPINAVTGENVEESHFRRVQQDKQRFEIEGTDKPLIAADKTDAQRLVGEVLGLDLSGFLFNERKMEHINPALQRDVWQLEWSSMPTDPTDRTLQPIFIHASFDAETGRLIGLHKNEHQGEPQPVLSFEEGKVKALQFIQSQLGAGTEEIFLMHAENGLSDNDIQFPAWFQPTERYQGLFEKRPSYSFYFNLGHQGVPIGDAGFHVEIDANTGRMTSFSVPHEELNVELPDNVNTVTEEAAKAEFLKENQLELAYYWPQMFDQKAPQGELVYRYNYQKQGYSYIDAFTGQTVYVQGK